MLTIFNRKELVITMDMNRQSEVRNVLSQNGIKYSVKTTNLQSAAFVGNRRGHTGNLGINQDYSYEYKVYVHKNDFDKASALIR